jgi:hypothetical protein
MQLPEYGTLNGQEADGPTADAPYSAELDVAPRLIRLLSLRTLVEGRCDVQQRPRCNVEQEPCSVQRHEHNECDVQHATHQTIKHVRYDVGQTGVGCCCKVQGAVRMQVSIVHLVAQSAHCLAQGKVGSGFDVAVPPLSPWEHFILRTLRNSAQQHVAHGSQRLDR